MIGAWLGVKPKSLETLRRAVKILSGKLSLKAVVLFGSRARGDWGPWSDYDLLIIADFEEDYMERIGRILGLLEDVNLPIEPHPYTPREAEELLRKGNPIIIDALEEGVILYGEENLHSLREVYAELKRRGLRKTKTSIILPS